MSLLTYEIRQWSLIGRNRPRSIYKVIDFPGAAKTRVTHSQKREIMCPLFSSLEHFFPLKTINYPQSVFTNYLRGSQGKAVLLYQLSLFFN